MSAHASSLPSALPALDPVRVGIVTASELEGRRLADVLARGGCGSVSWYRDPSDLAADTFPVDVVVASAARTETAVDDLSSGEIPVVLVAASLNRRAVDAALSR